MPSRLYAYDGYNSEVSFHRMISDAGVTIQDSLLNLFTGTSAGMRFDAGLIFGTNGRMFDPEAEELLGSFSGLELNTWVAPDVAHGLVYYLVEEYSTVCRLIAYDINTFLPVDALEIHGVQGDPVCLVEWGAHGGGSAAPSGLAFQTNCGQLVPVRGAEPAPLPPPPSLLTLRVSPATARGGTTVTGTVTLSTPTPDGGVQVLLASLDSSTTVPPAVTVPEGAATATFPITVHAPAAGAVVLLTAQLGGAVRTAHLTIGPAAPAASGQ